MPKPKSQSKKKARKVPATASSRSAAKRRTPRRVEKRHEPSRYNAWRYIKRANLVPDDGNGLPSTLLPKILELTGCETVDELHEEISRHNMFELPLALQERLAEVFEIKVDSEEWESCTLPLEFEDQQLSVPYPFKASPDPCRDVDIGTFHITEDKERQEFTVFIKMQIDTHGTITPRRPEDEDFCNLAVNGDLTGDSTDEVVKVVSHWLVSNGVDKRIATRASADEDFREHIDNWLGFGITALLAVRGAPQLGDKLMLEIDDDVGGFN